MTHTFNKEDEKKLYSIMNAVVCSALILLVIIGINVSIPILKKTDIIHSFYDHIRLIGVTITFLLAYIQAYTVFMVVHTNFGLIINYRHKKYDEKFKKFGE